MVPRNYEEMIVSMMNVIIDKFVSLKIKSKNVKMREEEGGRGAQEKRERSQ